MKQIAKNHFPKYTAVFGVPFLSYVLNLDSSKIIELQTEGGEVHDITFEMINSLNGVMETAKKNQSDTNIGHVEQLAIQNLRHSNGQFFFSVMREASVGERLKFPAQDDSVLDTLGILCAIAYPYILLPTSYYSGQMVILPSMCWMDEEKDFSEAVKNDPTLVKLFHTTDENNTWGSVDNSLGTGGAVQLNFLSTYILTSAAILITLRTASPEAYFKAACDYVQAIRAAVNGEKATVPAFAFYAGTGLPEGKNIPLDTGELKPISKEAQRFIPPNSGISDTPMGKTGMMFETTVEFKICVLPKDSEFTPNKPSNLLDISNTGVFDKQIQRVELGISLAASDTAPSKARHAADIIINPLTISSMQTKFHPGKYSNSTMADDDKMAQIKEWVNKVENADTQKISLAIRRFLTATNQRRDVEDSLIDAVVGLENLFGSDSNIAFAVANSVARLLTCNTAERESIFSEVKLIYNARSKVVHGTKTLEYEELKKHSDYAIDCLANCIKTLLQHRPSLINISSSERIKDIALKD